MVSKNQSFLTDRWNYIDLLEFIGIFFVIIYHSAATILPDSFPENSNELLYIRYYLSTILSTCVPLFFFANGYLLLNRKFNLKKHIIKTVNIIVLTCLWGIISILLLMPIENEYLSFNEIIKYLYTLRSGWSDHLWYMGALVCIYAFFPLLKIAYDNKKIIFIYFAVICAILTFGNRLICICITIFANIFCGHEINILDRNLFSIFNPLRGIFGYSFVYFCIGGLAHELIEKIKKIIPWKRIIIAIGTMLLSCTGLFVTEIALSKITGQVRDIVWDGYDMIFTFANVCAIFIISVSYVPKKNNIINKLVYYVSSNTLGIYFIHIILIHLLKRVITEWAFTQNIFGYIIYSFAIMIICLFIVLLIKKIPILKYLVKLINGKYV